jgi:hypothetical protein
MKKTQWGIWIDDIGWLEDSHTKDPKTDTYIANPSLWPTLREATKEAKELNTLWRGRKACYKAREYNK